MWLLFVPFAILLAVLLAAGVLIVGVASLLGAAWPVVLIALGIWMLARQDGRHRRARRWQSQPSAEPMVIRDWPRNKRHASDADKRAAAAGVASTKTELPVDVQMKIEQIRRKADALAAQEAHFPPFSQDLYLVRQTTCDYLPRTLDTYLGLARDKVDSPMVPGGKTPHQELKAQLDLLDTKLDEITRDLERQSHDRLMANRKFLQDRFELRNQPQAQPQAEVGPLRTGTA